MAWWSTAQGARLAINGLQVLIQATTLLGPTLGELFTHIHEPLLPSTNWNQSMGMMLGS